MGGFYRDCETGSRVSMRGGVDHYESSLVEIFLDLCLVGGVYAGSAILG